jgi:hypothetical protein
MTQVLAAIRPDDWNFPLLVHVFGALALVGALVTALAFQIVAWRSDDRPGELAFGRLAFRTLLFVAFPAWWIMRIGAQWIYSREGWDDAPDEPTWLGIGWITGEGGGFFILLAIILAWLNVRRLRGSETAGAGLGRAATVFATIALVMYVVTIWAMSGKPD